ncbi:recombinase family protein [Clostridium baratii]|uniref:recombinase family protein n=1 Tax=Clostridium baratii TaxID=1561 RepID=UPI0022E501DC|nr:recombinase family protein [Clostridium baratii]
MIAIYARQSVDKKDSISIESQIDFCKREIVTNEEYKVYKDKGFSGKNIDRPAFQQLLKDIESGTITRVIAYKLDRVSRSILDFNKLMEQFKKYDVEFVSVTEKFDTSTAMGRAMLNIVITFAQLEREQIAQRVKDNYYERGKQGRFLGGKVPFGYKNTKIDINNKKVPILIVNEEEACIVKQMFNMYAESDTSLGNISKYLNDLGYKSANGKAWDSGKISRILKNSLYVRSDVDIYNYYKSFGVEINNNIEDFIGENGSFIYGPRRRNMRRFSDLSDHKLSLGLHEGIIDSKTFLKCQYKLDANKQLTRSGSGKHTWLTGLTKCGYCKYSMSAVVNSSGRYLNCRGKTNLHVCDGHSKTIKCDDIEKIVESKIINKIKKLSKLSFTVQNSNIIKIKDIDTKIKIINDNIEKLISNLVEANNTTAKYINEKVERLDKEKNQFKKELQKLILEGSNDIDLEKILDQGINFKNLEFEDKKKVANYLINAIYIKDDEINIEWKRKL